MKTNILTLAITLTLGIILAGSLLMPVITDAQTNMGDPISYINTGSYADLYVTDDVSGKHTVLMESPNTYAVIDDEQIALSDMTRGFYIITDKVSVVFVGAAAVIYWEGGDAQYNPNWGRTFDLTYEDGVATLNYTTSGTTTTYTYNYSWIGYRVTEGGNYKNMSSTTAVYNTGVKDFIAMGDYTSGDNDTYYAVKDGSITISESDLYTCSIEGSSTTPITGTTDIYQSYLKVNVGDETFTPYIWAVAKEINGHQDKGAAYSLLGAVPIIVIIGLVLAATAAIMVKRND